jgi:hypothetical protein
MLLILLAALAFTVEQASLNCADTGANIASTQTRPLRGPEGTVAFLKISTADDHSKNSHLCSAEYQLLLTRGAANDPFVVGLLTSVGDYNRTLSVQLGGFSKDGKRVFGILSEGGQYQSAIVFEYDIADGNVQLIDLKKQFAQVVGRKCSATFGVAGTADNGAIVLELTSANGCLPNSRWLIASANGPAQPLPHGAPVVSLLGSAVEAP